MRRRLHIGYVVVVCIFCAVYLYSCFAPPTNTPCMPLGYPDEDRLTVESTKFYIFETEDPYLDVVEFYRSRLVFDPPRKDKGREIFVNEYSIRDRGTLFVCFHKLGGFFEDEVEIGCVFVRDENNLGIVEVAWSYGATTTAGCDYMLPDIEFSDY